MRKAGKQIIGVIFICITMLILSLPVLAKTVSDPIDDPSDDTAVFDVKMGPKVFSYSWADIAGWGKFKTIQYNYTAKNDEDNIVSASWTGVMLADIISDIEQQLNIRLDNNSRIKAVTVDNFASMFSLEEAKSPGNRYMVACDPVHNYDETHVYGDSYVRILRGDEETTPNLTNIRCLIGLEFLDVPENIDQLGPEAPSAGASSEESSENNKSTVKCPKQQGGDAENAVFYIALREKAETAVKYYYYTWNELKAYGEKHTFRFTDQNGVQSAAVQGVYLKSLLDNITDAEITPDLIIQYAQSDGFRADFATAIEYSAYKDKYSWLAAPHTQVNGGTAEAVDAMIALSVHKQQEGTDPEIQDLAGEYLSAYRRHDLASSAEIQSLTGVAVSYDGRLFTGQDGYVLEAVSSQNKKDIIETQVMTGLTPGMRYAVRPPELRRARLSAGQPVRQMITVGEGAQSSRLQFVYDLETEGETVETKESFNDLENAWTKEAINYLYQKGIVAGTGSGHFSPDIQIKRGDFVLMLYRAYALKAETAGNFADVPEHRYYYPAIATAKALGILDGSQDSFDPEGNIVNGDAWVILYKTLKSQGVSLGMKADLSGTIHGEDLTDQTLEAAAFLAGAGILDDASSLEASADVTRSDAAQYLYKALTIQ